MNKCTFLIVIVLMMTLKINAQTSVYKPFPEIYGDWLIAEQFYGSMGGGDIWHYDLYYTAGDTVNGLFTYKKVNQGYSGAHYPNGVHLDSTYAFSYRNDIANKKVFILLKDSIRDTLWYDFNLIIGDSLNINSFVRRPLFYNARVARIDSVLICGEYHKKFIFECPEVDPFIECLVEGVGFTSNFISTYLDVCVFEPTELDNTTCSSKDYCPDEPSLVSIILNVDNYRVSESTDVTIFPNPASTSLTINVDGKHLQSFSYSIIDCMGNTFDRCISHNSSTIDLSGFEKGLYFIQLSDKNGRLYRSKFIKD